MRNLGMVALCLIVFLVVLLVAIGIIGGIFISAHNNMVSQEEVVTNSLANLDAEFKRRADLIPNLLETVKGYTSHENKAIDKVLEARTKLENANSVEEKSNANAELSNSLSSLMVIVENYPDLKASQNFTQLADELAGTENRIAVARRDYNNAAGEFNAMIKKFPNNILASLLGFEKKSYLQTDEKDKEVPHVHFD